MPSSLFPTILSANNISDWLAVGDPFPFKQARLRFRIHPFPLGL